MPRTQGGPKRKYGLGFKKSRAAKAKRKARVAKAKAAPVRQTLLVSPSLVPRRIRGMSDGVTDTLVVRKVHAQGPRKSMAPFGAPCRYVVNNANNVVGQAGAQVSAVVGQWFSVQDIENLQLMVPTVNTYAGQTPTHFCLKNMYAEVTLANNTSTTQIYDIYDIVARRDIPNSSAIVDVTKQVFTPISAWKNGLLQQATTVFSGTVLDINQLGSRPTDVQLFNDYYQVIKHAQVVMPQNATHIHKVSIKCNKVFDKGELSTMVAYLDGLKGVTSYTMIVARGSLCVDTSTDPGKTSTTYPQARWVTTESYGFSFLQNQGSVWNVSNYVSQPAVFNNAQALQLNNPNIGPVIAY